MRDHPSGTPAGDVLRKPDSTAVTTALWRAAHLRLDAPPHLLEDDLGLRFLRKTDVLASYLGPGAAVGPDAWLRHHYMGEKFRRTRAGIAGRARDARRNRGARRGARPPVA